MPPRLMPVRNTATPEAAFTTKVCMGKMTLSSRRRVPLVGRTDGGGLQLVAAGAEIGRVPSEGDALIQQCAQRGAELIFIKLLYL